MAAPPIASRTVVVLGASYGGCRAARLLSQSLPAGWRLVVIDRNSHMNHVYVFPRFTILPQHAAKGFVPYNNLLYQPTPLDNERESAKTPTADTQPTASPPTPPLTPASPAGSAHSDRPNAFDDDDHLSASTSSNSHLAHQFIQANITSLSRNAVTFVRPNPRQPASSLPSSLTSSYASIASMATYGQFEGPEESIHFDYAVYALGSGMPDPVNVWGEHPNMPSGIVHDELQRGLGTKKCGIRWMQSKAEQLKRAQRIVIVGGGALGIQFATDLKSVYPEKDVTLLHSRPQLMPLYPIAMHVAVIEALNTLGVNVVLGERVVTWPEEPEHLDGQVKIVRTDKGRQFEADLVLPCTGQKPHTTLMAALAPSSISPTTSRIRVSPTLQVHTGPVRAVPSRANTAERLGSLTLKPPHDHLPLSTSTSTPPSDLSTSTSSSTSSSPYTTSVPTPLDARTLTLTATRADQVSVDETQTNHDAIPDLPLDHMYAIGDCADTGAIQAGHTAYYQAEVAARNILRQINAEPEELETYTPSAPAIKVSLGMTRAVTARGDEVVVSDDGVEDLKALLMWPTVGAETLSVDA